MRIDSYVDAVIGLQYGDEGKGKICAGISSQIEYEFTARYNGGPNAGHTIRVDDSKTLRLHQLPSSIAYKNSGYIGPGTVIDFNKLQLEVDHFQEVMGFDPLEYLFISPKSIVISEMHLKADSAYHAHSQGSTSSGIAPAYSSFYDRKAFLAGSYSFPCNANVETIEEVTSLSTLLLEGAQGHWLNPYQGNYPYTTSSSSHPASAASTFGFPARKIRNIIGVAKCYETRSGLDESFHLVLDYSDTLVRPEVSNETPWVSRLYDRIQNYGSEIGVTTGRKRQIRFLDLNRLAHAVNDTGTNILVINKWDILSDLSDQLNDSSPYSYYLHGDLVYADSDMKDSVAEYLKEMCPDLKYIINSSSPYNDIDWSSYL